MPEHLKALVFILVGAIAVFAGSKAPACEQAIGVRDFRRRRTTWLVLTLFAFVANNFWVFILGSAAVLLFVQRRETNRLALFLFLIFALPKIAAEIPGLGIVNSLFSIDYVRLLALMVLIPALIVIRRRPYTIPFGRSTADRFLAAYLIVDFVLLMSQKTFTASLREGVFYAFVDTLLPYYVASRLPRTLGEFHDAIMSLVVAAMVLSATLVTESIVAWMLYVPLEDALGMQWGWNSYILREGGLRASGPIGYPIAAGYAVAVAAGFYIHLKKLVSTPAQWWLGLVLLLAGLIAPLSRGPWVGFAVTLFIFAATASNAVRVLSRGALLGLGVLPLFVATSAGRKVLDYLPWIGSVESNTVTARELLLQATTEVLLQNPVFGTLDYANHPIMLELAYNNQGFLDLTNTYVVVGLSSGLVGLTLFIGFFIVAGARLIRSIRTLKDKNSDTSSLGRAILATLCGILVIIGTVSPVLIIPILFWIVAGLCEAYVAMTEREYSSGRQEAHKVRAVLHPRDTGRVPYRREK